MMRRVRCCAAFAYLASIWAMSGARSGPTYWVQFFKHVPNETVPFLNALMAQQPPRITPQSRQCLQGMVTILPPCLLS